MKKHTFIISHQNGFEEVVEASTEKEHLDYATETLNYTQTNVVIGTPEGEKLYITEWIGLPAQEDDNPLVTFGDYGFYTQWREY